MSHLRQSLEQLGEGLTAAAGAPSDGSGPSAPPAAAAEDSVIDAGGDDASSADEDIAEALRSEQRRRRERQQQLLRRAQRQAAQSQRERALQEDPFAPWTEAPNSNPRARLFDESPALGPSTLVPLFQVGGGQRRGVEPPPFARLRDARGRLFVPAGEGGGPGVPWCLHPEKPLSFPLRLGRIRLPLTCFVGRRRGAAAAQAAQAAAASAALAAAARVPAAGAVVEGLSFGRTYPADSPAASYYETVPCRPFSGSSPSSPSSSSSASGKLVWREMEVSEMREHDLEFASLRAVVKMGDNDDKEGGDDGESEDEEGGGGGAAAAAAATTATNRKRKALPPPAMGKGKAHKMPPSAAASKKNAKKKRKEKATTTRKAGKQRTLELHVPFDRESPEASASMALGFLIDRRAAAAFVEASSPPRLVPMGAGRVGLELEVSLVEAAFQDPDKEWRRPEGGGDLTTEDGVFPARFGWDETDRAKAAAAAAGADPSTSSFPAEQAHDMLPPQPVRQKCRRAQEDGEALITLLQAALTLNGGGGGSSSQEGEELLRLGPDCDGGINALSLGDGDGEEEESTPSPLPPPSEALLPHAGSVATLYSAASLQLPRDLQDIGEGQPPGLKTRALPHQLAACRWARRREACGDGRGHGALALSPLWVQLRAADGQLFYVFRGPGASGKGPGAAAEGGRGSTTADFAKRVRLSSTFYSAAWCSGSGTAGGMLCDEMGAGKSLTMLSLVLAARCPRGWAARLEADFDGGERGSGGSGSGSKKSASGNKAPPPPLLLPSHDAPTPVKTTLIVVPNNLLAQWLGEVRKHVDPGALKVCVYLGSQQSRAMAEEEAARSGGGGGGGGAGDGGDAAAAAGVVKEEGEGEGEEGAPGGGAGSGRKRKAPSASAAAAAAGAAAAAVAARRSTRARRETGKGPAENNNSADETSRALSLVAWGREAAGAEKGQQQLQQRRGGRPLRVAEADLCFVTYETLRGERFPAGPLDSFSSSSSSSSSSSASCASSAFSPLATLGFWRLVLDEAQLVSASNSAAALAASSLFRRHAWLCTGTPVSSSLKELAGLCEFLDLGEFADPRVFQNCLRLAQPGSPARPLAALFRAVALRRTRAEARLEMPRCEVSDVAVDQTRPERVAYEEALGLLRAAAARMPQQHQQHQQQQANAGAAAPAAGAGAAAAPSAAAPLALAQATRGGGGHAAARRSAALKVLFNRARQAASHPLLAAPAGASGGRRGRPGSASAAAAGGTTAGDDNLVRPAEPPQPMASIMHQLVIRACSRADAAARARAQAALLEAALEAARESKTTGAAASRGKKPGPLRLETILSSVGKEALEMLLPGGSSPAAIAARRSHRDGSLAVPGADAAPPPLSSSSCSSSSLASRWPRRPEATATEGARLLIDAFLTASSTEKEEGGGEGVSSPAREKNPTELITEFQQPAKEVDASWAKVFIEGLDLLAAVFSSSSDGGGGGGNGGDDSGDGSDGSDDDDDDEEGIRRSLAVRRSAADIRAALGLEDPDIALELAIAAASDAAAAANSAAPAAAASSDLAAQRFSRRARGMRVDEQLGAAAAQTMLRERGQQRDAAARVLLREFRAALAREEGQGGGRGGGRGGRGGGGRRVLAGAAAGNQTASFSRAAAAAASEYHALVHALNQSALNQQEGERQVAAAATAVTTTTAAGNENDNAASSCAVCLESFGVVSKAVTPCGHVFCLECIREALFSSRCCPLCRKPTQHNELFVVGEKDDGGDDEEAKDDPAAAGDDPAAAGGASWQQQQQLSPTVALSTALISSDLRLDALRAEHGAKMAAAVAAVSEAAATGGKVVVFSSWSRLLRFFGLALTSAGLGWVSLANSSPETRAAALESFRTDPGCSALLVMMSTAGGAAGLDLGHATVAVLLEPSLNPGLEAQAAARIQRLGQTRETRVVRLISSRTLDAAVAAVAAERALAAPSAAEEAEAQAAAAATASSPGDATGATTAGIAEVVDDRLVSVILAAHPP